MIVRMHVTIRGLNNIPCGHKNVCQAGPFGPVIMMCRRTFSFAVRRPGGHDADQASSFLC